MTVTDIEAHLASGRFTEAWQALTTWFEAEPSAARAARVNRYLDRLAQLWPAGLVATRVYVLRSITLEPLAPVLRARAARNRLDLQIRFGDYNQFEQEIAGNGALPTVPPDVVIIAARLDELAPALLRRYIALSAEQRAALAGEVLARLEGWLQQLRTRWPAATVLVHGFELPTGAFGLAETRVKDGQRRLVQQLNDQLAELCRSRPGVYLVDVDAVFAEVGRRHAYDPRLWAQARLPYSLQGLEALAELLCRFIAALRTPRQKCIVLDCDNTLWGGIVGEDGPEGIALGPDYPGNAFVAFQEALLTLHDRGVLLALCSKNNPDDVFEVLDRHSFQVLRREHLAALRVNWENKATNLIELARELNIGLDAMLFIDDSAFECALVRDRLPEVRVLQTPASPLELSPMLARLDTLDVLEWSAEDSRRAEMYQAEKARTQARTNFASLDGYLHSLDMRLDLAWTGPPQIPRVAQLTRKTNQFNLTTRRYSEQEIAGFIESDHVFVVHAALADRFGEYGLTGVLILCREGATLRIDTFLLSCRILGRRVEEALVAWVLRFAHHLGVAEVVGEYRPTAKNRQTEDLYPRLGFDPGAPEGMWRWPAGRPPPPYPDCFTLQLPS